MRQEWVGDVMGLLIVLLANGIEIWWKILDRSIVVRLQWAWYSCGSSLLG
jgi:hypothetical protein